MMKGADMTVTKADKAAVKEQEENFAALEKEYAQLFKEGIWMIDPKIKSLMEEEGDSYREKYLDYYIWLRRNPSMKFWLGYVSVPPQSILTDRSIVEQSEIDVHGGLTCMGRVKDPEHPDYTVYGFDCGHAWDIMPAHLFRVPYFEDTMSLYRTKEYVIEECRKLAAQLKALEKTKEKESKKAK